MAAAQERDLRSSPPAERRWSSWLTAPRRRVLRDAAKVGLAAALATFVAQLLGLPVPWFATISAVVAMEVTLRVSLRTARNATVGAALGAVLGLGLATVAKDQAWAVGTVVVASLVVFGLARQPQVGRQAALVASVIVLIPVSTDLSTPRFALVRFIETLIGIAVALVVNATVLPPRAYRGVRRHLAEAHASLARMYRLVVAADATGHRDAAAIVEARRGFRTAMRAVDDLWDEAMQEGPTPDELAPHWRATTRRIWELCTAMDDVLMDADARGHLEGARDELSALAENTAAALDTVAAELSGTGTIPRFDDLEVDRARLFDRVRVLQVHDDGLSFAEALAVFTFVNSIGAIASRLADLAVDPDAEVPARPVPGTGNGV